MGTIGVKVAGLEAKAAVTALAARLRPALDITFSSGAAEGTGTKIVDEEEDFLTRARG